MVISIALLILPLVILAWLTLDQRLAKRHAHR